LIWLLFALYGIYAAATEGVAKAWISDLIAEDARGTALGLFSMCVSFAVMLGSFLAGLLWDSFGSSVPFLLSAGVSLIIGVAILAQKAEAQIPQ
jgi:MFS family permease